MKNVFLYFSWVVICVIGAPLSCFADTGAQKKFEESIGIQQQTQKHEDKWALRKEDLLAKLQFLEGEEKRLQETLVTAKSRLDVERAYAADMQTAEENAQEFTEELLPFLYATLTNLRAFVEQDLPFLPAERKQRLDALQEMLTRPDVRMGEKSRRLFEALQVEMEYGAGVDSYQDTLTLQGQDCLVDVLRLGRVALFCRTPDGSQVACFDPVSRTFRVLPEEMRSEVNKAVDIALRERTVDLVSLPVGKLGSPVRE